MYYVSNVFKAITQLRYGNFIGPGKARDELRKKEGQLEVQSVL